MGRKVLVTGANGFIGSHLVEKLIENGYEVKCLLRKTSNLKWISHCRIEPVYGDVCVPDSLKAAVEDVNEIYHLGGTVRVKNNSDFYKINAVGTQNIIEATEKYNKGIEKFVYVSSQAAWGPEGKDAVSHYGKSKAEAEVYVKNTSNYSIVRPVAVYGPRDNDFLPIFKMAEKGLFFRPGSVEGRLSFIHISDCIKGILNTEINKEIFLSDGRSYTWEDIVEILKSIFNRKIISICIPEKFVRFMGFCGTVTGLFTGLPAKLNNDKVKELFGGNWVIPETSVNADYDLESGFAQTLQWYKDMGLI